MSQISFFVLVGTIVLATGVVATVAGLAALILLEGCGSYAVRFFGSDECLIWVKS
jgi:hypothetical protein